MIGRGAAFFILCAPAFFSSCTSDELPATAKKEITWSAHIAPIIFKNCTPCHRPGEAGGFDLLNYSDAKKKGNLIRFVTRTRYMPPWPADPGYRHFAGERVLSDTEITLVAGWVENGMKRGDSIREPHAPKYYTGSYFGKPDLVIKPGKPVQIKGNGTDLFLIMKYPFRLEKDTLIDFVEFVPHQRKLIHHVNGHLVNYDAGRKFNYFSGESVISDNRAKTIDAYKQMHIPYTDGREPVFPPLTPNVVYYLPGFIPPAYPEEIGGYRIRKNGLFLLNNIHYGPSNVDLTDSSHINVFFRRKPVTRPIAESQMGTFGISPITPEFIIPPNEVKTFHTEYTLSRTISMLSVNPHMHLIGTSFKAFAIKPGGDTLPLIRIRKWDFRWQYYYTFRNPQKLEAGTTIHVYGTYDNTSKNPDNPFHPPQSITQGNGVESMKTTEEMFQFIFTYIPYRDGDEKIDLERR
jgi:hypothetical protein